MPGRAPRFLLLGAILALLVARNLPWNLEGKDQALQAYAARQVGERGEIWHQTLPHGRPARKPPLAAWLSAAVHALTGSWTIAWRLPGLAAILLMLGLLVREGQRTAAATGGLLAAAAFGFNAFTPRLATLVRTDALLAACVLGAGWLVLRAADEDRTLRTGECLGLTALLAAGLLVKGPVAYAFLLPGVLLSKRGRAAGPWWCWVVALIPFAAWLATGLHAVPGFGEDVVADDFVRRFRVGDAAFPEARSWGAYLLHTLDYPAYLLHRCAPWSILLLALLWPRRVRRALREDAGARWLVLWIGSALVVMSLIPSRRPDRIFPLVAPLVLLLVRTVALHARTSGRLLLATGVIAVVAWSGVAVYEIARNHAESRDALVRLAAEARERSVREGWDLVVVSPYRASLLCYVGQERFFDPAAVHADAVIVAEGDRARLGAGELLAEARDPRGGGRVLFVRLR